MPYLDIPSTPPVTAHCTHRQLVHNPFREVLMHDGHLRITIKVDVKGNVTVYVNVTAKLNAIDYVNITVKVQAKVKFNGPCHD